MTLIIDYGIGNVASVKRSLEHCGDKNVLLSSDPKEIERADRIILPGVGAFEDGMKGLKERNLIEPIMNSVDSYKPILGICLGMQMLATFSTEFGTHKGLNIIEGTVNPILNDTEAIENKIKIPSIGWAKILLKNNFSSILDSSFDNSFVYLVHSFYFETTCKENTIATYNYSGIEVTLAIEKDNVIGFQFHPEKSAENGLDMLQKFINM